MATSFEQYANALSDLVSLDERVGAEFETLAAATRRRQEDVHAERRRAVGTLDELDAHRNRVQREVTALCREVGPVPSPSPTSASPASPSALENRLRDITREVDRVRRDWQWAQRVPVEQPPPPTPPPPVPVAAPRPAPAPEPVTQSSVNPVVIGAIVAIVLLLIVLIVVLV